ncbi:MAG: glycerol-3-phosphate dehydrogenase [Nitrospirae bacterium CG_4_10_14_0_8_um_filter_41_23]|nr:NAD(P)-dependent glycerol-3-phosphate dehydrogenase [Nitrospirota bacterium]PIQ95197.1 MAG: glycerol-3-phosphate dehydrogenase [Nitrospirae bacterium CG11_big_fil_rev_8_21_14_0_20_41_14]PIV41022.1 MAG: glycerol-3-phosphate dehydrogenase [Nitrospirae bacterium CG02_land_8_20_14_3_00_41_53]PIW87555.1 MAG: glycerol-3-phosphate dehydrogenase [Nitrospirae bacterium CG_4_8_14_3_um_filter_41_47]PIY86355.1 MAG: glycerol-3-phosphate dehydrogenase [Nitrospirae bacterium CG_4_10_14_0_8_um_filter_41_23]
MSYISVIGAGSWGTTLACLLSNKSFDVTLWAREKDVAEEINNTRTNSAYLPDITLPDDLRITHSIDDAVKKARYVLNAVPAQYTRAVFKEAFPYMPEQAIIISASKGIERGTLLTVSSILKELSDHPVAVLSGPSFAKEVIKKLPAAVTLATEDKKIGFILQEMFNINNFRVYTHDDILGVEIGGALKNVMAIASGISDSLGLGNNARASLITRGLVEMTRLGIAMGAKERTFSGLSGIGDLVLTCTSPLSRNYTVGIKLGQGIKLKDILNQTRSIAEGVATAESAFELSKKYNIEMPIVEQVYRILYEDKDPVLAVKDLLERSLKSEFYG